MRQLFDDVISAVRFGFLAGVAVTIAGLVAGTAYVLLRSALK